MKVVILAGGLGTRIGEVTSDKPKPMVEIGGRPILWHIMKIYHFHGFRDFIICLGYKGDVVRQYFLNYRLSSSDITIDCGSEEVVIHDSNAEDWRVTLVDTGQFSQTGSRVKKILPFVRNEDAFCLTYGDGVGDVDIRALIELHHRKKTIATVTAVRPPGRFGALELKENTDGDTMVAKFIEKPVGDGGYINGGFFVLSPDVERYLSDENQLVWENEPLRNLAKDNQLVAYRHDGFWHPMDTLRDRVYLENLWNSESPPWRLW